MHAWRKMKPRLGCLFVCLEEGVGGGKKGPLRHSQPELLSLIVVPSGGAEQAPDNLPPKKTESFSPYPPAPYQLKQRWRCEYLIAHCLETELYATKALEQHHAFGYSSSWRRRAIFCTVRGELAGFAPDTLLPCTACLDIGEIVLPLSALAPSPSPSSRVSSSHATWLTPSSTHCFSPQAPSNEAGK